MTALAELHQLSVDRGDTIVGRYAPSPTGRLHLGNLRTALLAWLQVRAAGGIFILRMEDLDRPRTKAGAAQQIIEDLNWLGLDWDEGPETSAEDYTQSLRDEIYELALTALRERELVFPCWCSRKDIREATSAPHGLDGPIYPGTCRPDADRDCAPTQHTRTAAIRCRVDDATIEFEDTLKGVCRSALNTDSGDFVVRRADGLFAYQLAVAVDDALSGVTDVVRGDDLLDSTPRQLYLLDALSLTRPRYWHVAMMLDAAGDRLSKRDGSDSLEQLRALGHSPEDVISQLAFSAGLIDAPERISARELAEHTSPDDFIKRLRL